MPGTQSDRILFGKCVIAVILALLFAQRMTSDARENYARGEALTLEQHTAEFEKHRADLMEDTDSFSFNATISVLVFAGLLAVYEVGGWAIGTALGSATASRRAAEAAERDLDHIREAAGRPQWSRRAGRWRKDIRLFFACSQKWLYQ